MKCLGVLIGLFYLIPIQGRAGETKDSLSSQVISIREVFKSIPYSLLPQLSENNRLDMIDFIDSSLKAEVENLFGGKSEMLALTSDSISIRISSALLMTILLLEPIQPIDSVSKVICVVQTYGTDSISMSTSIDFYSPKWVKLERDIVLSLIDKKRIEALNLQTIVNWPKERLKKD